MAKIGWHFVLGSPIDEFGLKLNIKNKDGEAFLCGSVGASSHKPKGWQLDSWSGHMPTLWVLSSVRCMQGWGSNKCFSSHRCFSLSLPLSLIFHKKCPWVRIKKNMHRPGENKGEGSKNRSDFEAVVGKDAVLDDGRNEEWRGV